MVGFPAIAAGRSSGVMVALVQTPSRSGWPSAVRGTVQPFAFACGAALGWAVRTGRPASRARTQPARIRLTQVSMSPPSDASVYNDRRIALVRQVRFLRPYSNDTYQLLDRKRIYVKAHFERGRPRGLTREALCKAARRLRVTDGRGLPRRCRRAAFSSYRGRPDSEVGSRGAQEGGSRTIQEASGRQVSMKRVLFDINVVLDVLLDRSPHSEAGAAAWAAVNNGSLEAHKAS